MKNSPKICYQGHFVKKVTEELIGDNLYEKVYVKGAVIVYAMVDDGRIYFIKEVRPHEPMKERWKPVTGFLEEDLSWSENAQKELQEEIGFKAKNLELISHVHNTGSVNVEKYFILATGLEPSIISGADDEGMILDKKLFTLDDLIEKTINGKIYRNFDSMGLFLLKEYLSKNTTN